MEEHQEGSKLINSDKGLKNMKTLYVTDLDGTLMRNDMTISEESVRMLNQLIDKGVFPQGKAQYNGQKNLLS